MTAIDMQISMSGQQEYKAAVTKYGQGFAEAVVVNELQLYADSLDCFEDYAEYDAFQEFIESRDAG